MTLYEYEIDFDRATELLKKEGKKVTAVNVALKMKELGAKCTMVHIADSHEAGVYIRNCKGKRQIVIRKTKSSKNV